MTDEERAKITKVVEEKNEEYKQEMRMLANQMVQEIAHVKEPETEEEAKQMFDNLCKMYASAAVISVDRLFKSMSDVSKEGERRDFDRDVIDRSLEFIIQDLEDRRKNIDAYYFNKMDIVIK